MDGMCTGKNATKSCEGKLQDWTLKYSAVLRGEESFFHSKYNFGNWIRQRCARFRWFMILISSFNVYHKVHLNNSRNEDESRFINEMFRRYGNNDKLWIRARNCSRVRYPFEYREMQLSGEPGHSYSQPRLDTSQFEAKEITSVDFPYYVNMFVYGLYGA